MTPPPPLDFFRKFIIFLEFRLPLALKGSFGFVIITPAILAQFSIVLNCIFVHFYTFHFTISAAMITAPIPDHLPGRLIKAAAATSDKDSSDKFRKTDQLPMMPCHNAHCVSGHSVGSDTAYVTRAPGHQCKTPAVQDTRTQ